MNPVTEVNPGMEYAYDGINIEHSHLKAKQSTTTSREDSNEKMESSTESVAKEISHTISEVPRSFAKSEAEPRSGDASLPTSSSIASLLKASHTEIHLEIEDKAESPLFSTSITVREPQGPLYGAGNMVGDLTNSNHFDKLSTEIQLMIIQKCVTKHDSFRQFSVSLDPNKQILLQEKNETQYTSILFVSRTFRKLYLKHLPIILPSFDKKSPICIHQDTVVNLRMEQLDLLDTKIWCQVQIPACFSEIQHLAVPMKLFAIPRVSSGASNADVLHDYDRIGNLEGTYNIGFVSKMIFACSNLRSLIATRPYKISRKYSLDNEFGHSLLKRFAILLNRDLRSRSNLLNLQRVLTGYRSKELAYYMTFGSSGGKNSNIIQNKISGGECLEVDKIEVTRICHLEIESFIGKYCCEELHLAEEPEQLLCGIDPDIVRGLLHRVITMRIDKCFNPSTSIEDTEQGKQILEAVKNAFEEYKKSNPDDDDSIKASMSNTSQVIES
ncbi:hypothetical protein BOTCAL_0023g00080 [Botryotinia calthae]|uniref:Uncharacterized protein n=1 Tax=Botryotinia calthae TaxID=38488 RepID=A0A4Y8DEH5_9HELO|nr:hypothetical protein BOTCAL_0023g00080 [Botryotinia calthae]